MRIRVLFSINVFIALVICMTLALLALIVPAHANTTVATTTNIKAAFYYPWFPENWHSTDKYHPTLSQYDSSNQTVLATHVAEAKFAGLDAFISSWWGAGTSTDTRLPLLLNAAAAQGFHVAPYYEKDGTNNITGSELTTDLDRLSSLASSPAWLRVNGKPVLFVYNATSTTSNCAEVTKWKNATGGNWYLDLKVFGGYTSCTDQPDSWHQYGPAVATDSQGAYSYTVSPGFNQYAESSPRLARDLTRFKQNLTTQMASSAQWKLITTFNEWGEGTSVEPATEWQSNSGFGDYLDAMKSVYVDGQSFTPAPSTTLPTTTAATSSSAAPSSSVTTSSAPSTTVSTSVPPTTSQVPSTTPVTTTPAPTSTSIGPVTGVTKVLTFIEENHSLSEMKSGMPYLYGLAQQYAYASNYKAIRHPSEPNYLAIAGGQTFGDTADHNPAFQVSGQSVFGQALAAGKTAKSYEESMSTNCQQANGSNGGNYAVKHNPWASFTNERTQCNIGDVPFGTTSSGNFLNDVTAGTLPNAGFVTPNMCNDAHDCSLTTADNWLKVVLPKVLAGPDYKSGHLAIVITADEDDSSQSNTVLTVVVNPQLNGAHRITTTALTHYSLTGFYDRVDGTPLLANATANFASAFGLIP